MAEVYVSNHPLVQHKLSILRHVDTEPKKFRQLVRELAALLTYEATQDLTTAPVNIPTPLTTAHCRELLEKIGLVPILRAGLGMVEGVWELMPSSEVWHIGVYRDEKTLKPVQYYNKLPVDPTVQVCMILDPMLATGGSAVACTQILKNWGVKKIKFVGLIGAPEGIATMQQAHPDVPIYLAAIDDHLNEKGYIVPGLGDAGDRQFGTG
ncbi:MAG: uracil phosphoribosyltransferase [Anaerolineaceae bacterium]|nr:uracil phosphoribosyltransferase [Anaerolineaceae bacterium]